MSKRKTCGHEGCINLVNRESLCYAHWYAKKHGFSFEPAPKPAPPVVTGAVQL